MVPGAASGQLVQTWNSEACPAGHPVLAVKFSRTYQALVDGKVIVTVLPAEPAGRRLERDADCAGAAGGRDGGVIFFRQ